MSTILLTIDTALENATVALSNNGELLAVKNNPAPSSHAGFVHTAIQSLLQEQGLLSSAINAVAVVNGPGSYTGLRVGLAAAKGICFALQIPLITLHTVELLAITAAEQMPAVFYIPIIDARRMEAFTAVYNQQLQCIAAPYATIITPAHFQQYYNNNTTVFIGNAITKASTVLQHSNICWLSHSYQAKHIVQQAYLNYSQNRFASLAEVEPLYAKAFYDAKKS